MATGATEEIVVIEISAQEEKGLRRVYDRLCDFKQKEKLRKEIQGCQERLDSMANPAAESTGEKKTTLSDDQMQQETERLNQVIERCQDEISRLEANPDRKIRAPDVSENLKFLGKKTNKKEVVDMVWEVDENLDQGVDWDEFVHMFKRNINDRTGLEPSKLYNMVQFMLYDADNNGNVSVDETMNMLYARYGRTKMEAKLRELFGEEMKESGTQGGEISFLEYLAAVQNTQLQTFLSTNAGKAQLAKLGKKQGINKKVSG
ncbi:unnamed protein product [Chrysoparadoxa australica]